MRSVLSLLRNNGFFTTSGLAIRGWEMYTQETAGTLINKRAFSSISCLPCWKRPSQSRASHFFPTILSSLRSALIALAHDNVNLLLPTHTAGGVKSYLPPDSAPRDVHGTCDMRATARERDEVMPRQLQFARTWQRASFSCRYLCSELLNKLWIGPATRCRSQFIWAAKF